jgi:hypothetical protein
LTLRVLLTPTVLSLDGLGEGKQLEVQPARLVGAQEARRGPAAKRRIVEVGGGRRL